MEEKLSGKLIGVALSFTTILASLYLLGFWSAFDIAILEFADFTDAVKLALYPALGSFLLLFMALGIAQMLDRDPPPVKLDAETAAKLRRQMSAKWSKAIRSRSTPPCSTKTRRGRRSFIS